MCYQKQSNISKQQSIKYEIETHVYVHKHKKNFTLATSLPSKHLQLGISLRAFLCQRTLEEQLAIVTQTGGTLPATFASTGHKPQPPTGHPMMHTFKSFKIPSSVHSSLCLSDPCPPAFHASRSLGPRHLFLVAGAKGRTALRG